MVKFSRRNRTHLKLRGPNRVKPMDSDRTTSVDASSPVKSRRKSKKPAQCGEQVECPLRSKCKAGACQPDPAKPNP